MPELLLEVGVEELPASMVRSAAEQLLALVSDAVREARLGDASEGRWYATPRRLIVVLPDVAETQLDQVVEKRGPAAKGAYGPDGSPTPALIGFAKGAGVDPMKAEVRDDYIWVKSEVRGRSAKEVLMELLPSAIRKISFEKTMRWGSGRTRFSRPIRWIVALIGGEVVPFELETVTAGNRSVGHRFLSPDSFEVASSVELLDRLRQRFVEPDPAAREESIRSRAESLGEGKPVITDALLEENVYLTEWPVAISGSFRVEFLGLPRPVLVTAMAKHERFFPVEDSDGNITQSFVSVTNAGDPDTVRRGNEWVLNARFNDAKFFFDEDSRLSLAEFLEKTDRIVFQEKLGTVRQRADRIAELASRIAQEAGLPHDEVAICRQAGLLCKGDLSTGLVSELPSLQGKVGGEYARRDGIDQTVCEAISEHYDPNTKPETAGQRAALITMCADQADRLAGYLGIGEAPTGSSDPFALRRAATMLIEAQRDWDAEMASIADWCEYARAGYGVQGIRVSDSVGEHVKEVLRGRYESLFADIPYDALDAAWATGWDESTAAFLVRARALAELSADVSFVRSAKRPANIVESSRKKGIAFPESPERVFFLEEEEGSLYAAAQAAEQEMGKGLSMDIETLRALKAPIDSFFDKVMVMTDDVAVRANRLALLATVDALFKRIGDFGKIVIEGE
ncbi:MAG: glycine--tRNA ligase subunit beta [Armatimonadetes bacterium]|nr:glycine--tRNA ligase subunit beta [Armatimonadota bacterium]